MSFVQFRRKRSSYRSRNPQFEMLEIRQTMTASMGWDGAGKGSAQLNYYVGSAMGELSDAQFKSVIDAALKVWSDVANITFKQVSTPGLANSLDFTFRSIDGNGGTLAQAYLPKDVNRSSVAGDVQFDIGENWEVGNAKGAAAFDLLLVAVHEIGHALGLEHTNDSGAVMRDSASPTDFFQQLDADDVDAILTLYAPSSGPTTSNPSISNPTDGTVVGGNTNNAVGSGSSGVPTTTTPKGTTPTSAIPNFNRPTSSDASFERLPRWNWWRTVWGSGANSGSTETTSCSESSSTTSARSASGSRLASFFGNRIALSNRSSGASSGEATNVSNVNKSVEEGNVTERQVSQEPVVVTRWSLGNWIFRASPWVGLWRWLG